jgi:hypothetical protein
MRCTACSGELILANVVKDEVPNVEHHDFICSQCHATERRVVFVRHGREDEGAPMRPPKPRTPALSELAEHRGAPGFFGRLMARIRGH